MRARLWTCLHAATASRLFFSNCEIAWSAYTRSEVSGRGRASHERVSIIRKGHYGLNTVCRPEQYTAPSCAGEHAQIAIEDARITSTTRHCDDILDPSPVRLTARSLPSGPASADCIVLKLRTLSCTENLVQLAPPSTSLYLKILISGSGRRRRRSWTEHFLKFKSDYRTGVTDRA